MDLHHFFFLKLGFLLPEKPDGTDWQCPQFLMMYEVQKVFLWHIQRESFLDFLGE